MKMKMKKIGKMSRVYEFAISKLGDVAIFMKVCPKFLTHLVGYFLLIKARMKMKMKKYEKMSLIFEFSISNLSHVAILMKIQVKNF